MKEPGHIYVMVNPSIEGLVKIGKTTRDPESRARELSQATGVPTPFYAAFSIEVEDCHAAEEYVYAVLEYNGFKRSPNREFFEMPLRSAVEVLTMIEKQLRAQSETLFQTEHAAPSASEYACDDDIPEHPGADLLRAVEAYYGLGDEIKDKMEALRLLYQSKALNFGPAYTDLAEYFMREAEELSVAGDNMGAREALQKAFEVLKEGAQKGHGRCYARMAELYEGRGVADGTREPESINKCWKKYFRSPTFISDGDRQWGWCVGLGNEEGGQSRVDYAREYLFDVSLGLIPLDPEIRGILLPLRTEIIEAVNKLTQYNQRSTPGDHHALERWGTFLTFVESAL